MSSRWRKPLFFALVGVVFLTAACRGDDLEPRAANTSTSALPLAPIAVTGLFTEARSTAPDEFRTLPEQPSSQFEPWDGTSTVLYDRVTGEELNLGQGNFGRFSRGGGWMGWSAGPPNDFEQKEARVIELSTLEQRSLGPGSFIRFLSETEVVMQVGTTGQDDFAVVNLITNDRTFSDRQPALGQPDPDDGLAFINTTLDQVNGVETSDGEVLLTFEVFRARFAGPEDIVVMTVPEDDNTNIFLVNIASGRATFIASSPITRIANHPFAANEDYVIWTDDYCDFTSPGQTRVYDRRDGTITELDMRLWVSFTSDGLIASGTFGAKALIDPETFEYVFVLPDLVPGFEGESSASDVSWSPDDLYASRGFAGGHGGLCG